MNLKVISGHVVDAAIKVHSALGPGLLESTYQACLIHELRKRGLRVDAEVFLPVVYEGVVLDVGYRIDLLVEDLVVVEVKAVREVHAIHRAQVLSCLRLSGRPIGLLLNFNVLRLKDGIDRLAN